MRPGPNNRRMRGRGNNNRRGPSKHQNFDSSGPEVKVRGNAQQLVDKYAQLSRDAATSGDYITAENYSQHAEHYFRLQTANANGGDQRQPNRGPGPARTGDGAASAARSGNGAGAGNETGAETTAGSGGNGAQPETGGETPSGTEGSEPKPA